MLERRQYEGMKPHVLYSNSKIFDVVLYKLDQILGEVQVCVLPGSVRIILVSMLGDPCNAGYQSSAGTNAEQTP